MKFVFHPLKTIVLFAFLIAMSGGNQVLAQTTKVAETQQKLKQKLTDTARLRLLKELSTAYSGVDPEKKYIYAKKYRDLAERLKIDSTASDGYTDMGIAHGLRSQMDSALYYFSKGYEKAVACNYRKGIARSLISIGFTYSRLDNKQEAINKYLEALKIFKEIKMIRGINQCYINIGSLYFDMSEYKSAEVYFKASYKSYMEANEEVLAAGSMFSLGNTNRMLGRLDKAHEFYSKSLAIREKAGDLNGIALSRWGLGMIAVERKQYDAALKDLDIALKIDLQIKEKYHQAAVLITIAEAYLGKKEFRKAEETAKESWEISKEIKSWVSEAKALETLTNISEAENNITKAFKYQKHYLSIRDSIKAEKATNAIKVVEFERVKSENDVLQKDNEDILSKNTNYIKTISVVSMLLVIVILLTLLLYKRNREKNATNKVLENQKGRIAKINQELEGLNAELTAQMTITAAQNEELEKLNIVKNKFFSIVSHDLRSPLATLQMLFGLYRRGQLNDEEMNEMLNSLEETIYMTTVFLDNLLNWSKSQLDGMAVKPSEFSVGNLISENIRLLKTPIELKDLRVENNVADSVTAYADPNMINVVVRNLLSNCVKFCSHGDTIALDALEENGQLLLSVRDTGPGIAKTDLDHLFDLEHTVSMGTSGETGHHIGLILCRDMIVQNNGSIDVESEFGKGTTFRVRLPLK